VAQGEAPAITYEYVPSLRDVDAPSKGPVQPGAKFRRTRCVASPSSCAITGRPSSGRAHFERGILDRDGPDPTTRL